MQQCIDILRLADLFGFDVLRLYLFLDLPLADRLVHALRHNDEYRAICQKQRCGKRCENTQEHHHGADDKKHLGNTEQLTHKECSHVRFLGGFRNQDTGGKRDQ